MVNEQVFNQISEEIGVNPTDVQNWLAIFFYVSWKVDQARLETYFHFLVNKIFFSCGIGQRNCE